MSASALLSILTGGALNGASGSPVSDAHTAQTADLGATGFPSFSHLMGAESTVAVIEPAAPSVTLAPYASLVQGLPLTLEDAAMPVETVQAEVFAASAPSSASEEPDVADVSLTLAPQTQQDGTDEEEIAVEDTAVDVLAAPVTAPVQIVAHTATSTAAAPAADPAAGNKAVELAAALLAPSSNDEAQNAPASDGETAQNAEQADAAIQLARQNATPAHSSQAHAVLAPSKQLQAAIGKATDRASTEASEGLAATDAQASASKTSGNASGETVSADTPKTALRDAVSATPAANEQPAQPLTNDTAPQDTEALASEPVEQPQTEMRHTDTTRLSRATVETTAQIAASILRKLEGRTTRFDMVLTPEDLGSVDVSMEIDAEGRMTARLAFDNPAAATELRTRAEELRRQLIEAGFQLSEKSLEFTDRESNPRGGFQQFLSDERSNRRAFAGGNRLAAEADAPVAPVWTSVTLSPSGVDMKV